MTLSDVACSSGAACTTAKPEPSHVLRAVGLSSDLIHSSIRFSVGRFTTEDEVAFAIERVTAAVGQLKK